MLEMGDDDDDDIGLGFSRSLVVNLSLDGESRAKVIEESIQVRPLPSQSSFNPALLTPYMF